MRVNILIRFLDTFLSLIIIIGSSKAQVSSEFWIKITSYSVDRSYSTTMYFGNHVNATYCLDSLNTTIRERSCPPDGCNIVWEDIPLRTHCFGLGLSKYDFRGISTNIVQKDTFKLVFCSTPFTPEFHKWRIEWPDSNYLKARCDSMSLLGISSLLGTRIDMFKIDSLVIDNTDYSFNGGFFIYKYGCNIIDDVTSESFQFPVNYSLDQSYPNPFNPTTIIKYQLPNNSRVTLKVYNVLGQVIATLSDEVQQTGFKSVTWNATDVSSGVYFYRLDATSISEPVKTFTQVKKMVLVR